ncbi:MAG: hypothetical protein FWE45_05125 [Firmicutes bacterium]|nr:hypothetical protein [Bacillota bacterium]
MQEVQNLKQLRDQLDDEKKGGIDKATAIQDLRFLCSRTGYGLLNNVNLHALYNSESKKLCDFLVIGHDTADKSVAFPIKEINVEDPNMYVAVVAYTNGQVRDAYLFKATEFKKPGLFSMFKNKNGIGGIDIGKEAKLRDYSFGNVINGIK